MDGANTNDITANCKRIFVHRDYSEGMQVKFDKNIPRELEGKISRELFEHTITQINSFYEQAERLQCSTVCEGCLACLTSYIILCCMTPHYDKHAKLASDYIESQNKEVFMPRGLLLVDPMQRGLRVIEICILNDGTMTV